jgi:hypothetical protein
MFDFNSLITSKQFSSYFAPGRSLNIAINLENFTMNPGEAKDFRVNYAFTFDYYD